MAANLRAEQGSSMADEALVEVLRETDLLDFQQRICDHLQLTRLEHFEFIGDTELQSLGGLSLPAIRRLRAAIEEKRKKSKFSIFRRTGTSGRKSGKKSEKRVENPASLTSETGSADRSPSNTCLIPKEQLKLMEKLGEGSFAVVRHAIWEQTPGRKKHVAVKLLRDSNSFSEEIQLEIENMCHLKHPNLIQLYGLVFTRPIMMVVELRDGGALLDRLRDSQKPVLLATQMINFSVQIAKGMAYLEVKRFIHRDLAARNVLLNIEEKGVKIGDFGLMRALPDNDEHYVMSGHKKVPFAWCPPESLKKRQFSHASDVWSFGVTLWEMFSFGEEPWCGYRGPEILQKIQTGERLSKPVCCPCGLYQLMQQCWATEPEQRPRFMALKDLLKEFQLPIAECRDPQMGEGSLELSVGDKVIVIQGSPENYRWYGQNARTRKFGVFQRKAVVFKGSKQDKDISRPIKGSFVHTGHGDARGGTSWGRPECIDEIYLQNPMPLIDFGSDSDQLTARGSNTPLDPRPEMRTTPTGERKKRPVRPPAPERLSDGGKSGSLNSNNTAGSSGGSAQEDYSVDPFAPFDDYEETPGYGTPGRGQYYSVVPTELYRFPVETPPERDSGLSLGSVGSISFSTPQNVPDDPATNSARSADSGVVNGITTTFGVERNFRREATDRNQRESSIVANLSDRAVVVTPPVRQNENVIPQLTIQQESPSVDELDPFEVPTCVIQLAQRRSYKDIYNSLGSTCSSNSSPPPMSFSNMTSTIYPSPEPAVPCASSSLTQYPVRIGQAPIFAPPSSLANEKTEARDSVSPQQLTATAIGEMLGSRGQGTGAIGQSNSAREEGRRTKFSGSPTARCTDRRWTVDSSAVQNNLVSQSVVTERRTEVNQTSLRGPNNYEYRPIPRPTSSSQLYGTARQPQAAAFSSAAGVIARQRPQATGSVAAVAQFPSTSRPHSASATAYDPSAMNGTWSPANFASGNAANFLGTANQQSSQLSQSLNLNNKIWHGNQSTGYSGSMLGFRPSTPLSGGSSQWGAGILLPANRTRSVPDVASSVVLDEFDPLSSKPPADLVSSVQKLAPFVQSPERCSVVLKRCNMDVTSAVKELKIQKLVDMGLVTNRVRAVEILDKCNWDVNSAAEAALS